MLLVGHNFHRITVPIFTVFRLKALRYRSDGYPAEARWQMISLETAMAEGSPEIVTIEDVLVATQARVVFAWGRSGVVIRLQITERPDGGVMLGDAPHALPDS